MGEGQKAVIPDECNELIEIGNREYPADDGTEENMEEYADAQAARDLADFFTLISEKEVKRLRKENKKNGD